MAGQIKKAVAAIFLLVCAFAYCGALRSLRVQGQRQSDALWQKWRPTREFPGVGYVGSRACAECHADEAKNFFGTPMAHAAEKVSDCETLIKHPSLKFSEGNFSYQIVREGRQSIYTVSDGAHSISEPVLYCFGQNSVGQTYVFEHNGALVESRVSYFQELQNLNLTIKHPRSQPVSLEDALGRRMSAEDGLACFSCHSTAAIGNSRLQFERLIPGVSCEACHGPGEKHLAAVKAHPVRDLQIFNPGSLDSFEQTQEFCGACHMSFEQVLTLPNRDGINNLRYQPYRIFNSRAHFINDSRLSCTACHDPHKPLERKASFYDEKCLACHLSDAKEAKTEERAARACPVSRQLCVTCHMPKVEVPEAHFKFTDHWIRIVKLGEPPPQ